MCVCENMWENGGNDEIDVRGRLAERLFEERAELRLWQWARRYHEIGLELAQCTNKCSQLAVYIKTEEGSNERNSCMQRRSLDFSTLQIQPVETVGY